MHKFTKYGLDIEYDIVSDNQLSVKVDGVTVIYKLDDPNNKPSIGDGMITMIGMTWCINFTIVVLLGVPILAMSDFFINYFVVTSSIVLVLLLLIYYIIAKWKGVFERGCTVTFKNKTKTIIYRGDDGVKYMKMLEIIKRFA